MSELRTLRAWFDYNIEARRRYLAVFASLSSRELTRDRGASYPSLLRIQEHTLWAIFFWLRGASRGKIRKVPPDPGNPPTLEEIRVLQQAVDDTVREFMAGLSERDLRRTYLVRKGEGFERNIQLPVRDMLWHLLEEELQHRGELNALLWQIDVEPPILDWLTWNFTPQRKRGPTPR
jgi:uncharacterized damage-inducible protein DinB